MSLTWTPGDHGVRLHDDEGPAPSGPNPREPGPEDAIGRQDAKSPGCSLVDTELVTKRQDLGLHGGVGPELAPEERCDAEDELEHSDMVFLRPPKGLLSVATCTLRGRCSSRDGQASRSCGSTGWIESSGRYVLTMRDIAATVRLLR
jgi:hypothetical protein